MATPTREAIQSFMSITGASESLALRKLEEYGGNLNQAVSAHFLEVERNITNSALPVSPRYNPVDMNNRSEGRRGGILPLLSSVRSFKPSLLLDPSYRRNLFNQIGVSSLNNHTTFSNVGDMRGAALEYNSGDEHPHFGPRHPTEFSSGTSSSYGTRINQNALQNSDSHLNSNDVESEMMQAAIEASKRDFEDAYLRRQYGSSNELSAVGVQQRGNHEEEEDELAHALSLSLKTAEEERAIRELAMKGEYEQLGNDVSSRRTETTSGNSKAGSSSIQHSGPGTRDNLQNSKDAFYYSEWGGISSKELYEAIMLESHLFSQIPEGSSHGSPQTVHKPPSGPDRTVGPRSEAASNLSSSTIMEQRLLWEQQDNEYLASLLADRKKEMNVQKEAETHSLKGEGSQKKRPEGEEFQRVMATKEVSLPKEPAIDDKNAVTLLVRMPDGSRHARRFLKSDKLQLLFDFIDVGKLMNSGTYRVVRPYPRQALSVDDGSSSLNELGLTSKQEALFLEPI